jgi:hypothetical protein
MRENPFGHIVETTTPPTEPSPLPVFGVENPLAEHEYVHRPGPFAVAALTNPHPSKAPCHGQSFKRTH